MASRKVSAANFVSVIKYLLIKTEMAEIDCQPLWPSFEHSFVSESEDTAAATVVIAVVGDAVVIVAVVIVAVVIVLLNFLAVGNKII